MNEQERARLAARCLDTNFTELVSSYCPTVRYLPLNNTGWTWVKDNPLEWGAEPHRYARSVYADLLLKLPGLEEDAARQTQLKGALQAADVRWFNRVHFRKKATAESIAAMEAVYADYVELCEAARKEHRIEAEQRVKDEQVVLLKDAAEMGVDALRGALSKAGQDTAGVESALRVRLTAYLDRAEWLAARTAEVMAQYSPLRSWAGFQQGFAHNVGDPIDFTVFLSFICPDDRYDSQKGVARLVLVSRVTG
jgi:hypothetical protein